MPSNADMLARLRELEHQIDELRANMGGIPVRFAAVSGGGGTAVNPLDLTYLGEHPELIISDTGWDRDDQGDNDGVIITMPTGNAYYHAGEQKWYEYNRDFTWDNLGWLKLFSSETRIEIDEPEICT